jgi:hypothetical protein
LLAEKAPEAAKRAGQAIMRQFRQLETSPDIGRPFADLPELRELMIAFGDSGYVALYRHEPVDDACTYWYFGIRKKQAINEHRQAPLIANTAPARINLTLYNQNPVGDSLPQLACTTWSSAQTY